MNPDMSAALAPFREITRIFEDAAKTRRYSTKSYAAFRIADGLKHNNTYLLEIKATSLPEAVDAAKLRCFHKDRLLIVENDDGKVTLHVYAIRQGKPKWIADPDLPLSRRVCDLYAELVCSIDGGVLAGVTLLGGGR